MPIANLEDCEIHYEEYGTGFPLLLVPGLGGVGSYWAPQIEAFARHFRVIVHDHRGTGQSSKSRIRYSLEQMAGDTLGLMNALGIEKAHLLGHSTGGAIAQILCVQEPQRLSRVVMYATWTKADEFFRRCFAIRRELLLKCGVAAYVEATPVFLHPSWWIRDNADALGAADTIYGTELVTEIVDSRIEAVLAFDWTDRLDRIETAVLVLGVRNDHLTPAYFSEELAGRLRNSELVILPDGGHVASQILPEKFNEVVLDYLLKTEPATPG